MICWPVPAENMTCGHSAVERSIACASRRASALGLGNTVRSTAHSKPGSADLWISRRKDSLAVPRQWKRIAAAALCGRYAAAPDTGPAILISLGADFASAIVVAAVQEQEASHVSH